MKKLREFTEFFTSIQKELRKVSWLRRKELVKNTYIVLTIVLILTVFFGLSDFLIQQIIDFIF